tara:strand:+ start:146 stop:397 length:252 start_codon:yes stop_codon:yes gene_type:complete
MDIRIRERRGLGKYDAPLRVQQTMGYSSFKRGEHTNPYTADTMQYREWNRGYNKAYYDNLDWVVKYETRARGRKVFKGEVQHV